MSTADVALAKAAALKKSKPAKPATKKSNRKPVHRVHLKTAPWKKVAEMYKDGKGPKEIADTLKLHSGPDAKPECKYSRIANILTRLSKGVKLESGETIKINRGSRSKKASK